MVSRQIITDNKADVVSMSFGEAELFYTKEFNGGIDFTYLPKIMDDIFAQGNAQGISFFASSGRFGRACSGSAHLFRWRPETAAPLLHRSTFPLPARM